MLPMLAPFLAPGLMSLEARRRHRLPPEQRVRELLDMCFAPGHRESPEAFAEMVDVARNRAVRDQWNPRNLYYAAGGRSPEAEAEVARRAWKSMIAAPPRSKAGDVSTVEPPETS